jgi:hypothetical protein
MLNSLAGSIQPSDYIVPDLTEELRKGRISYPPTIDGLVSCCTHAMCADDPDGPLDLRPGSTEEQDFIYPPSHAWRHLGTQSVQINNQSKIASLSVVNTSQRWGINELGSNQFLHGNGMLRVLVTHDPTIDDNNESEGSLPSEAVLSIDNIPHWHVFDEDDNDDHEPDPPAGVICKIPPSVITDIMTKLDNPGNATIPELQARAFVKDINEMLSYHVDGVGSVESEPWPVPQWDETHYSNAADSANPSEYADRQ